MPVRARTAFAFAALIAAGLHALTHAQSLPVTQPTTRAVTETFAAAQQRISRIAPGQRAAQDTALLTGLDLALALGRTDANRAAALIDATGYHALPLSGDLPLAPEKPVPPKALRTALARFGPFDIAELTTDYVEVLRAPDLAPHFPAVATWMLPTDFAVFFRSATAHRVRGWLEADACVVVRLRGERATIIGGNLLAALPQSSGPLAPVDASR